MPSRAGHRNGQAARWPVKRRPRAISRHAEAMPKITAYIIAFNEAAKIEAAVASVLWADEVLVADSNSTDNTAALATALGARVVQVPFHGFGDLRNRTIEHCTPRVDLQPRFRRALHRRRSRDEILATDRRRARARRLSGAAPLLHDGTLDHRLRLVSELPPAAALPQRRDALHARSGARGLRAAHRQAGRAPQNAILQFPFRNLDEVIRKMNRYSTLGAAKLTQEARVHGERASATACGRSSSTTSSSAASRTAGPASSSPSATSKARSTATPSATRKPRTGSRRRARS